MPTGKSYKLRTKGNNLYLRVCKGHFATTHSHINYYIDVTAQKTRLSEARAVAEELLFYYKNSTLVDTILCLDGMEVIGTCLAEGLTREDYGNVNAHQMIYIMTPECTVGSQLIFRENTVPMIEGKHVLILAASVTTGYTATAVMDAVRYYGGTVVGVCSIFATQDKCGGIPVSSVFNPKDIPDYTCESSGECRMCKNGEKIDALINSFGFSRL